jgi:hypothetical protein
MAAITAAPHRVVVARVGAAKAPATGMAMATVVRAAARDLADLAAADPTVAQAVQAEVPAAQEKVKAMATDRRMAAAAARVAQRAAVTAGLPAQRAKAAPATQAARVVLAQELEAVRVLRDRRAKVTAARPVAAAQAVTVRLATAGKVSRSTCTQTPVSLLINHLRNVLQEFPWDVAVVSLWRRSLCVKRCKIAGFNSLHGPLRGGDRQRASPLARLWLFYCARRWGMNPDSSLQPVT